MEDITHVDYRNAKKVFKNVNNKHLGDCHDLYVPSDALFLADIFKDFRNKCIETRSCSFSICTRISMVSLLRRTEV